MKKSIALLLVLALLCVLPAAASADGEQPFTFADGTPITVQDWFDDFGTFFSRNESFYSSSLLSLGAKIDDLIWSDQTVSGVIQENGLAGKHRDAPMEFQLDLMPGSVSGDPSAAPCRAKVYSWDDSDLGRMRLEYAAAAMFSWLDPTLGTVDQVYSQFLDELVALQSGNAMVPLEKNGIRYWLYSHRTSEGKQAIVYEAENIGTAAVNTHTPKTYHYTDYRILYTDYTGPTLMNVDTGKASLPVTVLGNPGPNYPAVKITQDWHDLAFSNDWHNYRYLDFGGPITGAAGFMIKYGVYPDDLESMKNIDWVIDLLCDGQILAEYDLPAFDYLSDPFDVEHFTTWGFITDLDEPVDGLLVRPKDTPGGFMIGYDASPLIFFNGMDALIDYVVPQWQAKMTDPA